MPHTKVKDEKIEGHVVAFAVDDGGTWYATCAILDGATLGKTPAEAKSKITARLRRQTLKLEIKAHLVNALPISEQEKSWHSRSQQIQARECFPVTLTGISQRRGGVMYRYEGGIDSDTKSRTKQPHQSYVDSDHVGIFVRRLTVAEEKQYRALRDAFDDSRQRLNEWIEAFKIPDVEKFLEAKIAEAVDRVEETPSEGDDPRTGTAKAAGRRKGRPT